jgi:P-type conjugative transfer protein TrbJ
MMNNAELIKQVTQLAQQIQNQITMIQDMIHNTLTIPDQLFRNVKGIYSKVKGIIDRTQGLAYNLANMDEELKRRFRSYADMSSLSLVSDFSSEYKAIVGTQMETVRSTMEAIGVSFEELVNDDASALKELQQKASSATGRNELIQATNQMLGFMAEDAMKLRQLQMMQAQMAGTAYEAERARSDLSNKRIESFFKRGNEDDVYIPDSSLIDRFGN